MKQTSIRLTQEQKYHVAMAGEFFVAAELQRRGYSAAVTFGNAKKADVVASSLSDERAVVIEVKTTSNREWVVGSRLPLESTKRPKPWVFVYLPIEQLEPPSYYVLLQSDLYRELLPEDERYRNRFKELHDGEDYGDRVGVVNFPRTLAEKYKDKWETITDLLHD
jgi:hypothetical protein